MPPDETTTRAAAMPDETTSAPRWTLPLRDTLAGVSLYAPDSAPCAIDLSDNTNVWGPPPVVLEALRTASAESVARYPMLYSGDLKPALAEYAGVQPDEIVTGCGSDEIIYAAMRAFAGPGDRVAHPSPSFTMIPAFSRMSGLEPVAVPLDPSTWDVDFEALLATNARIIYLCSPNNPTGTLTSRSTIERVAERAPGVVILDEAYAEFAEERFAARAPGWERVLVARTMSKAFGLAGLRFGYGVGAAALVRQVEKSRGPYTVTSTAERAVAAALTDEGLTWVRDRAADAIAMRVRFEAEIARRPSWDALPSAANFVLLRPRSSALPGVMDVARSLEARGIALRAFANLPVVGPSIRVGMGPWPMLQAVLDGLDALDSTSTSPRA